MYVYDLLCHIVYGSPIWKISENETCETMMIAHLRYTNCMLKHTRQNTTRCTLQIQLFLVFYSVKLRAIAIVTYHKCSYVSHLPVD